MRHTPLRALRKSYNVMSTFVPSSPYSIEDSIRITLGWRPAMRTTSCAWFTTIGNTIEPTEPRSVYQGARTPSCEKHVKLLVVLTRYSSPRNLALGWGWLYWRRGVNCQGIHVFLPGCWGEPTSPYLSDFSFVCDGEAYFLDENPPPSRGASCCTSGVFDSLEEFVCCEGRHMNTMTVKLFISDLMGWIFVCMILCLECRKKIFCRVLQRVDTTYVPFSSEYIGGGIQHRGSSRTRFMPSINLRYSITHSFNHHQRQTGRGPPCIPSLQHADFLTKPVHKGLFYFHRDFVMNVWNRLCFCVCLCFPLDASCHGLIISFFLFFYVFVSDSKHLVTEMAVLSVLFLPCMHGPCCHVFLFWCFLFFAQKRAFYLPVLCAVLSLLLHFDSFSIRTCFGNRRFHLSFPFLPCLGLVSHVFLDHSTHEGGRLTFSWFEMPSLASIFGLFRVLHVSFQHGGCYI